MENTSTLFLGLQNPPAQMLNFNNNPDGFSGAVSPLIMDTSENPQEIVGQKSQEEYTTMKCFANLSSLNSMQNLPTQLSNGILSSDSSTIAFTSKNQREISGMKSPNISASTTPISLSSVNSPASTESQMSSPASITNIKHQIIEEAFNEYFKPIVPRPSQHRELFYGILKAFLLLENRPIAVKDLVKVVVKNKFAKPKGSTPHQTISAALSMYINNNEARTKTDAILYKTERRNKDTASRVFWSLNLDNPKIRIALNALTEKLRGISFSPLSEISSLESTVTSPRAETPEMPVLYMTSPTILSQPEMPASIIASPSAPLSPIKEIPTPTITSLPILSPQLPQTFVAAEESITEQKVVARKNKRKYVPDSTENHRVTRQRTEKIKIESITQPDPLPNLTNQEEIERRKVNQLAEKHFGGSCSRPEGEFLMAGIKGLLMLGNQETNIKNLANAVMKYRGFPQAPAITLYIGMCKCLQGMDAQKSSFIKKIRRDAKSSIAWKLEETHSDVRKIKYFENFYNGVKKIDC
ncbi:10050_t:CDS:2 [Ambispora gerdemannii]|uniref:10050_t:CDS:1 n=1 Tax=Ambispora gerdemannii TaxID=144530 RepID=A0A9N9BDV1_9GLOM|nr:10050_t:CDS:2 [Ambispora gerdemannii]